MLTGMTLELFGHALPASSRPEMIATWFFFVLAGYVQWFIVVPKILRWGESFASMSVIGSGC